MSRLLPFLPARGPLRRGLIATALGASLIAAAPSASAGCNSTEGAVVGALIGGLAGGAIGNEIRDEDNDRYGYYGRGYGRGYGYGGRGYRYNPNSGDGDGVVVAGALIGALAGAAIGSEAGDCDRSRGPVVIGPDSYGQSGYRPADPYARGQVTRSGEYGWGDPQPSAPAYPARPAYPSYPSSYPAQGYPQQQGYPPPQGYPAQGQPYSTVPPAPRVEQRPQAACETVYSETQFPDGRVTREPVKVCRDDETGQWYRAGSATSEELYGY